MASAEQVRIVGRLDGEEEALEAVNLDTEAAARISIEDDGSFALEIEGAPPDRLRIQPYHLCCEPPDYVLTAEGADLLPFPEHECISLAPVSACCRTGDGESCTINWSVQNLCEERLVVRSATPRRATVSITLTTELPLELDYDEIGTVSFTMNGRERISEVFFIELDGAEEATNAVSLRSEP